MEKKPGFGTWSSPKIALYIKGLAEGRHVMCSFRNFGVETFWDRLEDVIKRKPWKDVGRKEKKSFSTSSAGPYPMHFNA